MTHASLLLSHKTPPTIPRDLFLSPSFSGTHNPVPCFMQRCCLDPFDIIKPFGTNKFLYIGLSYSKKVILGTGIGVSCYPESTPFTLSFPLPSIDHPSTAFLDFLCLAFSDRCCLTTTISQKKFLGQHPPFSRKKARFFGANPDGEGGSIQRGRHTRLLETNGIASEEEWYFLSECCFAC